ESLGRPLRPRIGLERRSATVYVRYAHPSSLNAARGAARERFRAGLGAQEVEEEKHRFIQRLGFRLLRAVNEAAVAGATAVSATALLGAPRAACRMSDFLAAAHALTGLLRTKGARITESLDRNERSAFRESVN